MRTQTNPQGSPRRQASYRQQPTQSHLTHHMSGWVTLVRAVAPAGDRGDTGPAPELSGVRDWRPGVEADNRLMVVFFRPRSLAVPLWAGWRGFPRGDAGLYPVRQPCHVRPPVWRRGRFIQP